MSVLIPSSPSRRTHRGLTDDRLGGVVTDAEKVVKPILRFLLFFTNSSISYHQLPGSHSKYNDHVCNPVFKSDNEKWI